MYGFPPNPTSLPSLAKRKRSLSSKLRYVNRQIVIVICSLPYRGNLNYDKKEAQVQLFLGKL